ncbi:MAG: LytTR family DNA-binding domain-containing protein [Bacteroidota bacterium]
MKILIIEDEPAIARRTRRLAQSILGDSIQTTSICHSVESGLAFLEKQAIDLLLLDLNLHGADGFAVLEKMVAASFHTIIISAYKEKAITAFEYGVLDFVPKPFNQGRLAKAFQRLQVANTYEREQTKFLAIQKKGRYQMLSVEQLLYAKGAGIYTELFFKDGRKEIHNKNLEKLGQVLPPHFDRIHKSYIINNLEIEEILLEVGSKYTLVLNGGVHVPISRGKYKALRERWSV